MNEKQLILDERRWGGTSANATAETPGSGTNSVAGPPGPAGVAVLYTNSYELAVCQETGRLVSVTMDEEVDPAGADLLKAFGEPVTDEGPDPRLSLKPVDDPIRRLAVAAAHLEHAATDVPLHEGSVARLLLATERADVLAELATFRKAWVPSDIVESAVGLANATAATTEVPSGPLPYSAKVAADACEQLLGCPADELVGSPAAERLVEVHGRLRLVQATPQPSIGADASVDLVVKIARPRWSTLRLVPDEQLEVTDDGGDEGSAVPCRVPAEWKRSISSVTARGPVASSGRADWYRVAATMASPAPEATDASVWVVALDDDGNAIGGSALLETETGGAATADVAVDGVPAEFVIRDHPFTAGGWASPCGDDFFSAEHLSRVALWSGRSDLWAAAVFAWLDAGDVFRAAWAFGRRGDRDIRPVLNDIDPVLVPILDAVAATGDIPAPGFGFAFIGAWTAAMDPVRLLSQPAIEPAEDLTDPDTDDDRESASVSEIPRR